MKKGSMWKLSASLLIPALLLAGCSKSNASEPAVQAVAAEQAQSIEQQKELTVDELYALAKEEGSVTVYSMSSRINSVKESFEAKYPGVSVVVYDMRQSELLEKFQREYEAGIRNADIIFVKDTDGSVYNEFVKRGQLAAYNPSDLTKNSPAQFQSGGFAPYFEMKQIFYNTEVYPASPIDSWWDLTRDEYKGKLIIRNPIENSETMGLFLSFVSHPDEMAQSYRQEFGKELELDGTSNAGYEFLKRLAKNDLIVMTSDTDIVSAVGAPGQANPPFGIATSSKMRDAGASKNLFMDVAWNLSPRLGVSDPAYLYIADKAKGLHAAQLLIRWMGGEVEGTGAGFKPFHVRGSWPTRNDVQPVNTPALDTLNLWPLDLDYNYLHQDELRNFWLTVQ